MKNGTKIIISASISFSIALMLIVLVTFVFYAIPEKTGHNLKSISNEPIKIQDILATGKTFDLLAVEYRSFGCSMVRVFTNSRWSHIAMLYRVPDTNPTSSRSKLFVMEALRTKKSDSEIQALPFEIWMKRNQAFRILYKPCTLVAKKQSELPTMIYKTISLFAEFFKKEANVNMNLFHWANTLSRIPYQDTTKKQNRVFCTEFICMLLQEAGILEKKIMPCCFTPKTLMFYLKEHIRSTSCIAFKKAILVKK